MMRPAIHWRRPLILCALFALPLAWAPLDALSRARVPSATCAKGTDDGTTSRASCRHARDSSASPDADTKGTDTRCSPRGVSHRSAPATHTWPGASIRATGSGVAATIRPYRRQ